MNVSAKVMVGGEVVFSKGLEVSGKFGTRRVEFKLRLVFFERS